MHADPVAVSRSLGAQLHHFGMAEFVARVESCDPARVERDLRKLEKGTGAFCRNGPAGASHKRCQSPFPDSDLAPNSAYYLAISDLMAEEGLDALALRCWPELPNHFGHWPYLAMMRLTEEGWPVALEGDVDGAILGLAGGLLGIGVGYLSDWLDHDEESITLWHPGHAPRAICEPGSLRLGRHFNNDLPLVVNARLAADRPITLARLWRCDGEYRLTTLHARTAPPRLDALRRLARLMGMKWVDR